MRPLIHVSSVVSLFLTLFINSTAAAASRYEVVLARLDALQKQYSATASIFTMGTNDDGVEIKGIRISTTPNEVNNEKIGHIVVSTHHGNELKAPEFTMYFIEELLKRYNGPEIYRGNLADQEWTIIPVLNISGYNVGQRNERGYDPNRDYPGPCISAQGGKLKSIRELMKFMSSRVFSGSLTVHGYAGALTYPWGVSVKNTHTQDHNAFEKITAKAASFNGYTYGTSTDIVYPCDGAYEDYAYWKYGMWSLLLELKDGSTNDIKTTSLAIASYFDELDSSPSTHNQLQSQCYRSNKPDLHNE